MAEPQKKLAVAVLLDWQNIYNTAREAFDLYDQGSRAGNVNPWVLGKGLAAAPDRTGCARELARVDIYRGMPDQARDARTYSAYRAQTAAWKAQGGDYLNVWSKLVKYRDGVGREKGIDVWLAVDLIRRAMTRDVDRVVVFSGDTDLIPALEAAVEVAGEEFVEVAAWDGPGRSAPMLRLPEHKLTERTLRRQAFDRVADMADYNLPKKARQAARADWDQQISAEGRVPRRP